MRILKISLGFVVGHLIVGGIDFNQHRPGLNVLIVLDVELDDMAGDAGADGIHVAVDLSVVGRFVAAHVSVNEKSHDQKNDDSNYRRDTKTGALGARRTGAEIPFRSR